MKHVVITGGSRGIGKGLALEFLKRKCIVTISGRKQETLNLAIAELNTEFGSTNCHGLVCDVCKLEDLENLWNESAKIRPIDIWINNAGVNHPTLNLQSLDEPTIKSVLNTNITGTVLGSRVALHGMTKQGFGFLYNMEGFGSDGRVMNGMSIYGTSKSAVRYFTRSLIKEEQDSQVNVGSISPGMVLTGMILEPIKKDPEYDKKALRIFHILADSTETVTPWIVNQILSRQQHGKHIAWLTGRKISARFLFNMFKKRKVAGLPTF